MVDQKLSLKADLATLLSTMKLYVFVDKKTLDSIYISSIYSFKGKKESLFNYNNVYHAIITNKKTIYSCIFME